MQSKNKIAYITLGMHRSGTSALSGVLARLGCSVPNTPIRTLPENSKGFYESRLIARLNDSILFTVKTKWNEINTIPRLWFESKEAKEFTQKAAELISREFNESPLIALKDPRISLLAPLWFDALSLRGYNINVLFVYRSASDVASSLAKRNDIDQASGRLLWLRYVLDAEGASRTLPRLFIGYDRLLEACRSEIYRIENHFRMTFPQKSPETLLDIESFLSPSMRHHKSGPRLIASSPSWINDMEAILEQWGSNGENGSNRHKIDEIMLEFEKALPALKPLVLSAKTLRASDNLLKSKLVMMENAKDQSEVDFRNRIESLCRELKIRENLLLGCEQTINERDNAMKFLSDDLLLERQKCQAVEDMLKDANSEISRIMNSKSVKYTAPLRKAFALLRRKKI